MALVQFPSIIYGQLYNQTLDYRTRKGLAQTAKTARLASLGPAHKSHTTANKNGDNDSSNGRRRVPHRRPPRSLPWQGLSEALRAPVYIYTNAFVFIKMNREREKARERCGGREVINHRAN